MATDWKTFLSNARIPNESIDVYSSALNDSGIVIEDFAWISKDDLEKIIGNVNFVHVGRILHEGKNRIEEKEKNATISNEAKDIKKEEKQLNADGGLSEEKKTKTKTAAVTSCDNFRSQLQDFIDENIEPNKRYEAAKLMSFAVNLFSQHVKDMDYQLKDLKDLEKEVTGRGLIEIIEERFLDPRCKKDFQNLSHKERFEKILILQHVEVLEIKRKIDEDHELTLENFPEYAALAHNYFSNQIHIYLHRKKKIDLHNLMLFSGVFPGRAIAVKAVKILFSSLCSPIKGGHKRLFKQQSQEVLVGLNEPNPYNTHIRFVEEDDGIKPRKLFLSSYK